MKESKIQISYEISPSKTKKVCGNCKHFSLVGVHLGVCLRGEKMKEKLDSERSKYFEANIKEEIK